MILVTRATALLSAVLLLANNLVVGQDELTVAWPKRAALPWESFIIKLNEQNWHELLYGEWMVEFCAASCPTRRTLAATWEHFAEDAVELNVNVGRIDVTTSPSLVGRFFIKSLPTIMHVKNGEFRHYNGLCIGDSLMTYIEKRQWENTAPVPAWMHPNTLQMTLLSLFIKHSDALKEFTFRLQEEYGFPAWLSCALVPIVAIVAAVTSVLCLMCVIDHFCLPESNQYQRLSELKDESNLDAIIDEEFTEDDIDETCESEEYTSSDESDEEFNEMWLYDDDLFYELQEIDVDQFFEKADDDTDMTELVHYFNDLTI